MSCLVAAAAVRRHLAVSSASVSLLVVVNPVQYLEVEMDYCHLAVVVVDHRHFLAMAVDDLLEALKVDPLAVVVDPAWNRRRQSRQADA